MKSAQFSGHSNVIISHARVGILPLGIKLELQSKTNSKNNDKNQLVKLVVYAAMRKKNKKTKQNNNKTTTTTKKQNKKKTKKKQNSTPLPPLPIPKEVQVMFSGVVKHMHSPVE